MCAYVSVFSCRSVRLVLRRHARTHWRLLRKGLGSSRYNATKRICIAFRVMGARMPKAARYRLQSLLHARVPWRVIDELEWLRRILPRSCSKPPKRAPIPQIRKKIHFGEWDCSTTQLRPRTLLLFGMQVNGCANSALENERHSGKEVPATH